MRPPFTPPPATSAVQQPAQWSRPPFEFSFGVRPNSPVATTSVVSSKPRSSRSVSSAANAASNVGATVSRKSFRSVRSEPPSAWQSHDGESNTVRNWLMVTNRRAVPRPFCRAAAVGRTAGGACVQRDRKAIPWVVRHRSSQTRPPAREADRSTDRVDVGVRPESTRPSILPAPVPA